MGGERQTYTTLEASRGLAALAVVLFHANVTIALPKYFRAQIHPLFLAGDSGVALFFVLSGAVMVLAHGGQLGQPTAPWPFIGKRFRRIYLPLWPILVAILGAQAVMPALGAATPEDIAAAFLIIPWRREAVLAVEWTLRHEVLFYALFAILLWRPRSGATLMALWFAASFGYALGEAQFPLPSIFSPFNLLFLMGMTVAFAIRRSCVPAAPLFAAAGAVLFAAAWCWASFTSVSHHDERLVWTYGLGASLLLAGLMELERSKRLVAPPALVALGGASYSLYLIHFPLVSLMCKIAVRQHVPPRLLFIAITVTAVGLALLYHRVVERPLIEVFRSALLRPKLAS